MFYALIQVSRIVRSAARQAVFEAQNLAYALFVDYRHMNCTIADCTGHKRSD